MPQPKRHWVKLKVPSSILQTLPHFPTPISKTRQKKIIAEEKKLMGGGTPAAAPKKGAKNTSKAASKVSSPAPSNQDASNNNFKINSGLKELSTSGLTMNSINSEHYLLDKTGKPTKKWVKKPTQFKTFSGFKIKYVTWRQKDQGKEPKTVAPPPVIANVKEEENTPGASTANVSASETPEAKTEA